MGRFQRASLVAIGLVLVLSVAARALAGGSEAGTSEPAALQPQGLLAEAPPAASEALEPGALERWLPLLTEGSLFALIGFALGYTTRKLVKLLLILLALAFVAVQAAVHFGGLEVDWGGVIGWLNAHLLNLRENATVPEMLTDRVPAAGGLGTGYLLGFRRG